MDLKTFKELYKEEQIVVIEGYIEDYEEDLLKAFSYEVVDLDDLSEKACDYYIKLRDNGKIKDVSDVIQELKEEENSQREERNYLRSLTM
jgi:hypothetical protein